MFGAEFFVLIGFIVFLCLLGYVGAYRMLLGALDKRGKDIADELAEAAKLRAEATALLEGFEKKKLEAEANAAAIVAEKDMIALPACIMVSRVAGSKPAASSVRAASKNGARDRGSS